MMTLLCGLLLSYIRALLWWFMYCKRICMLHSMTHLDNMACMLLGIGFFIVCMMSLMVWTLCMCVYGLPWLGWISGRLKSVMKWQSLYVLWCGVDSGMTIEVYALSCVYMWVIFYGMTFRRNFVSIVVWIAWVKLFWHALCCVRWHVWMSWLVIVYSIMWMNADVV